VHSERELGQSSLFGGDAAVVLTPPQLPAVSPWAQGERLKREKAVLGLYISGHPLECYRRQVEVLATPLAALTEANDRAEVVVAGIINSLTQRYDKKGKAFAIVLVEDFTGSTEVLAFSDVFEKYAQLLITDRMVLIAGQVSTREGEKPKLRANRVVPLSEAWNEMKLALDVRLTADATANGKAKSLLELLGRHAGNTPVLMQVELPTESVAIRAKRYSVALSDPLLEALERLLGADSVRIRSNGAID